MKKTLMTLVSGLFVSQMSYAASVPVAACYEVPVPAALFNYASFPVSSASIDTESVEGQIAIDYVLPDDITGAGGRAIHLTGQIQDPKATFFNVTEGTTGTTGQCARSSTNLTCMLHYADLKLDHAANQAFLTNKYLNDPTLAQRMQVMVAFGGDAVGILKIDLTQTVK